MTVKKIEGTWFLVDRDELIDSFDTKAEAELALFDKTKGWRSLWDAEHD